MRSVSTAFNPTGLQSDSGLLRADGLLGDSAPSFSSATTSPLVCLLLLMQGFQAGCELRHRRLDDSESLGSRPARDLAPLQEPSP